MIQHLVLDTNILILVRILSVKFQLSAPEIHAVVLDIQGMGKSISVFSKECPINEDLTDNVFINLAIDGNTKIIVSGDSHLLNLKEYKKIKIITVSEFLSNYS